MSTISIILALVVMACLVVWAACAVNKPRPPRRDPETQDDFHQSMVKWSDTMERRNK